MTKMTSSIIRLYKGPNKVQVGTISARRAQLLMEVKNKIEKEAGITAELALMEGNQPNAFSTPTSKVGPVVGINLGMIELVGDDRDGYAAILGHEYAHLTLKHRETRMDREGLRQAGSAILSIVLAARGVNYGAGDIANFATTAISMTFSREEERDADSTGLKYAASSGFDPYGAVRIWERMAARGSSAIPFLSSHPSSEERVENMKALAKAATEANTASESEIAPGGVKIHGVYFAESDNQIVVKEAPEGARTTLQLGDKLVGCHEKPAQEMKVGNLSNCRSHAGTYAFVVERGSDQATAVLLRPR